MKRRQFLGATAGLAMLSWPAFIRAAFTATPEPSCPKDGDDDESTSSCAALVAAYRRALAADRPLLVLVIPDDQRKRYERGELLGGLINWGDEPLLAALGLCEVVCARMRHARVLPALAAFAGAEPAAVLVETAAVTPPYRTIEARAVDEFGWDEKKFEHGFAALSGALRTEIGGSSARAARLRSQADVVELARQARARLKNERVPGSKWAQSTGCGVEVERLPSDKHDDRLSVMACGMGFVPAKARRMLYFYADRRTT